MFVHMISYATRILCSSQVGVAIVRKVTPVILFGYADVMLNRLVQDLGQNAWGLKHAELMNFQCNSRNFLNIAWKKA